MKLLRETLVCLAFIAVSPAAQAVGADCTPQVSITEQVVEILPGGGSIRGQYAMTTGDLCGLQIVALAVDNNDSLSAYAYLSGWNALVVTDNFWDAGMVVGRDDFNGGELFFTTGPAGIGSFVSFFGPAAQLANIYWLSRHYGGPVLDDSTALNDVGTPYPLPADAFQFDARRPASVPIAFLLNPGSGEVVAVTVVPEPATIVLLSLGLVLLSGRCNVRLRGETRHRRPGVQEGTAIHRMPGQ